LNPRILALRAARLRPNGHGANSNKALEPTVLKG